MKSVHLLLKKRQGEKISRVMQVNSCKCVHGETTTNSDSVHNKKKKNPRFSAQLWKARLQASVEKPDSLVTAAMKRLEEIRVSLRTEKSGFL